MTKLQKLVAQINQLTTEYNAERDSINTSVADGNVDSAILSERTDKLEAKKKEIDSLKRSYAILSEDEQEAIREAQDSGIQERTPANTRSEDSQREELYRFILGGGQISQDNIYRAVQQDAASLMGNYANAGAYVANEQLVQTFIQRMDDAFRLIARGSTLVLRGAGKVSARELGDDLSDATWDDEEFSNLTEDNITISRRNMTPNMLTKLVKFGRTHLYNAPNFESLVTQRISQAFGRPREKAMIRGTGDKQPLGICIESTNGVTSDRFVETDAAGVIGFTDLINMYTSLKEAYRRNAIWVFSRDTLNDLMKLEDTAGNPIWTPAGNVTNYMVEGSPGMLLGRPVFDNEYMEQKTAGAWVSGDTPIIFADFTHYWHVFGETMSMQRLTEKYAEENKIGLISHMSVDGAPILPEAFSVLKIQ